MLLKKFTQYTNLGNTCGVCNSCNSGCNSCNEGCYAMNSTGFNIGGYCRVSYYQCSTGFAKCYNTGSCTTSFSNNAACSIYQGCGTCQLCEASDAKWSCSQNNNNKSISKCYLCVDCHSAWGSLDICNRCNATCETDNGCKNCVDCNTTCVSGNGCNYCWACQSLDGSVPPFRTTDCTLANANPNVCQVINYYCALNYKVGQTCTLGNMWSKTFWWCNSNDGCVNIYQDRDICYGNNSWCTSCNTKDNLDECVYCELSNDGKLADHCGYCVSCQACVACEGKCQSVCNTCQKCNSCLTVNGARDRSIPHSQCRTCVAMVGHCLICDAYDLGTEYCRFQVNSPIVQPGQTSPCDYCVGCVSIQTSCEYCDSGCQTCDNCIGPNAQ